MSSILFSAPEALRRYCAAMKNFFKVFLKEAA